MLTGGARIPTKRSETARLHSKMVDGVRREGFLHTAASTKTLPVMHIGISRASVSYTHLTLPTKRIV